MEDSCSQSTSQTTLQTREEKLRCRRERKRARLKLKLHNKKNRDWASAECEIEHSMLLKRLNSTFNTVNREHNTKPCTSVIIMESIHKDTRTVYLRWPSMACLSKLRPPCNAPWHAQACPTMYYIPLVRINTVMHKLKVSALSARDRYYIAQVY